MSEPSLSKFGGAIANDSVRPSKPAYVKNTFFRAISVLSLPTRSLWGASDYIGSCLFPDLKLPMPRDEVAYYTDVFLVHHVIGLAVEAEPQP